MEGCIRILRDLTVSASRGSGSAMEGVDIWPVLRLQLTCLSDMGDAHGEHPSLHRFLVSYVTSPPCIHNSPGRFFAITEIKLVLAHIVVTYDLKLEEGKQIPPQLCIASSRIPRNVDALFRKRQE